MTTFGPFSTSDNYHPWNTTDEISGDPNLKVAMICNLRFELFIINLPAVNFFS